MNRGDIVTVAVAGDYGKPRPAAVVQSDRVTDIDSILVCPISSTGHEATALRLAIPAEDGTGLRRPSFGMVEKIVAVRKDKCGRVIGRVPWAVNPAARRHAGVCSRVGWLRASDASPQNRAVRVPARQTGSHSAAAGRRFGLIEVLDIQW